MAKSPQLTDYYGEPRSLDAEIIIRAAQVAADGSQNTPQLTIAELPSL